MNMAGKHKNIGPHWPNQRNPKMVPNATAAQMRPVIAKTPTV